jgi:hypothetical protein
VPLALTGLSSLVLWAALGVILKDWIRAGVISSFFWMWFFAWGSTRDVAVQPLFWLWFFTWGSSHDMGNPLSTAGLTMTILLVLFTVYSAALLVGSWLILRRGNHCRTLSAMLNVVAIGLVAWRVAAVSGYEVKRYLTNRDWRPADAVSAILPGRAPTGPAPDIYYIVLDGYARDDVLQKVYRYDNRPFLDSLKSRGFQIADDARANYGQTLVSLASSLNLTYLDELAARVGVDNDDRHPLEEMIRDSALVRFLRQRGYHTVAFPSGFVGTKMTTADTFIKEDRQLTEFQRALLRMTPVALAFRATEKTSARPILVSNQSHAAYVLYPLEHIPQVVPARHPVFVFAHIICPHPPFLFDRNGRLPEGQRMMRYQAPALLADGSGFAGTREQYIAGYREQLMFLNGKVLVMLDRLLAEADRPTVIILQGDHGPGSRLNWEDPARTDTKERMGILLACRLPEPGDAPIDRQTSPVNVFRMVLDRYLGADLPLLPNESFYSTSSHPYRFLRCTDQVRRLPPDAPAPAHP